MKFLSNIRASLRRNLLKNNAGQGATEYILLLVVIVGLVIAFKDPIKAAFNKKMVALDEGMSEVTTK